MSIIARAGAAASVAALSASLLAGCHEQHRAPAPEQKVSAAIADGLARGCLQQGSMYTSGGRHLIVRCAGNAVSPARKHAAEKCTGAAIYQMVPAPGQTRYDAVRHAIAGCLEK